MKYTGGRRFLWPAWERVSFSAVEVGEVSAQVAVGLGITGNVEAQVAAFTEQHVVRERDRASGNHASADHVDQVVLLEFNGVIVVQAISVVLELGEHFGIRFSLFANHFSLSVESNWFEPEEGSFDLCLDHQLGRFDSPVVGLRPVNQVFQPACRKRADVAVFVNCSE